LEQHDEPAKKGANSNHPTDGISVPNVDEDFVRKQKVIDCDGIEAGFEFLKEIIFGDRTKTKERPGDKQAKSQRDAVPARGIPAGGQNAEPKQQWNNQEQRNE